MRRQDLKAILLGGAAGGFVGPDAAGHPAHVRGRARRRLHAGLRRRHGVRRGRGPASTSCCGSRGSSATSRAGSACRAGSAPSARRRRCTGSSPGATIGSREDELALLNDIAAGDARRVDLRPGPDGGERGAVGDRDGSTCSAEGGAGMSADPARPAAAAASTSRSTARPSACPRARRSSTRAAPRASTRPRSATPTTSRPVNACRVCVVEVEGSRVLVPACSRTAEDGMKVEDRHRAGPAFAEARDGVPRVDRRRWSSRAPTSTGGWTSTARIPSGSAPRWSRSPAGERDADGPGHHHEPDDPTVAEGVAQPVKIDNELYVRDYSRCILCYKCVEACGVDAQNTFAIAVAGRGFDARISTEYAVPLERVRVRLLRQLHRRLPDRRADVHVRARHARGRHLGRGRADGRRTRSARTAASAASSRSTCRTTRS